MEKTTTKYYAFFSTDHGDGAMLSAVPGDGPTANKYKKTSSLKSVFPPLENAVMIFDSNFTKNTKLYDIIDCLDTVLVINKKVKEVFKREGITGEFLQVRIWDHNDAFVSDDYYIFNNLEAVEFIDMEKSHVAMNPLWPDRVKRILKLVVRDDVTVNSKIFCPTNMKGQLFITEELRDRLIKEEITGFHTYQADGWDGFCI
ncbi:imm11 family protein [Flavivirga algicola]|uniref:Immunity MXAN-0049 protein domain-containing protein n=1 Tax=Flavivirga algicola TaxID=2729136 RepID=A0ABX1S282_9FLAO|nr:DUF1629 domain-containing protein [Flavivirga algicola]NMH89360.1 hypothetical protein [Flavivirga algicola]